MNFIKCFFGCCQDNHRWKFYEIHFYNSKHLFSWNKASFVLMCWYSCINIDCGCCPVAQSCLTLCDPMACSAPGLTVLCHLLELAQTCACGEGDAIQPTSVVPFSSCLQSFPASRSFLRSQPFVLGGQNIGVLASVLLMNIQDWFSLELTGMISLQSKGLLSILQHHSSKHQFFGTQLSLLLNPLLDW